MKWNIFERKNMGFRPRQCCLVVIVMIPGMHICDIRKCCLPSMVSDWETLLHKMYSREFMSLNIQSLIELKRLPNAFRWLGKLEHGSGKGWEKVGNFVLAREWQPWLIFIFVFVYFSSSVCFYQVIVPKHPIDNDNDNENKLIAKVEQQLHWTYISSIKSTLYEAEK